MVTSSCLVIGLTILCHAGLTIGDRNVTRSRIVVFPKLRGRDSPKKPEVETKFLDDAASTFQQTQGGSAAKILFYSDWSEWSTCSTNCEQTRKRRCQKTKKCGNTVLKETRPCPNQHNRRHKRKCHRTQNRRKHKHKNLAFHIVQLYNHPTLNSMTQHRVLASRDGGQNRRQGREHQNDNSEFSNGQFVSRPSSSRKYPSVSETRTEGEGKLVAAVGTSDVTARTTRPRKSRKLPSASETRNEGNGELVAAVGRSDVTSRTTRPRNSRKFPSASETRNEGDGELVAAVGRSDVTARAKIKQESKLYGKWGPWADCSRSCTTRRYRWCKRRDICGDQLHKEAAYCYVEGSYCQRWIHRKIQQNEENEADVDFYVESYRDRRGRGKVDRGILHNKTDTTHAQEVLTCGMAGNTSSRWAMMRIIGGRPTYKGRWPWQVAVLNKYKEAFCGGTLVAPQWVLTAAHCIRKRLYVRIGEHDLSHAEGTEIELRVSQMVSHPSYDSETVDNDVALLRLPLVVRPDRYHGLACLPKPRQVLPTSQYCTIIGWGKRKSSDSFGTDVLHEAQVPIVSNEVCRNVYEDYHITNNMFCAGYRRGRMDSCAGDSGGPLLCKDANKWTIFGITSFGEGCGKRGKYGIYTRLSNYVKWIQKTIKGKGKY